MTNKNTKFVGILFVIAGILAFISIIISAFYGKIYINFAVPMFIVGIGIINKRESSRKWGRFWSILIIILSLLCIPLTVFGTLHHPHVLSKPIAHILIIVICLLIASIFLWCDFQLRKVNLKLLKK